MQEDYIQTQVCSANIYLGKTNYPAGNKSDHYESEVVTIIHKYIQAEGDGTRLFFGESSLWTKQYLINFEKELSNTRIESLF